MNSMMTDADHAISLASPLVNLFVIVGLIFYSLYIAVVRSICYSFYSKGQKRAIISSESNFNYRPILAFAILANVLYPLTTTQYGLDDLIKGNDPKLNQILKLAPSILKGPRPPLLLQNRHLQFAPWIIQNELHKRGIPYERHYFSVKGCIDKSDPECAYDPLMDDEITLDIFPPFGDDSELYPQFNASSPVILFAPGLRCTSDDLPGNMIVRVAYGQGIRSIAINRRGHTPDQLLKAPRWNLFGDVDDLEQVYWHIKTSLLAPNTPIFLHGISSGTAVAVSALAKWDKRRKQFPDRPAPSFVGVITVVPGYDTSKALLPERFKFPYNFLLTFSVKDHFVSRNEEVLRSFNSDAVDAALNAANLQEFVDAAAPFAGYANASEYYRGENPVNDLHFIETPTFVLNAIDDPCCDIANLYEKSPNLEHGGRSYADIVRESKHGLIAVSRTGSHCPFLDGTFFPFVRDPLWGGWMLNSWADQVSVDFYTAALQVYDERRFM